MFEFADTEATISSQMPTLQFSSQMPTLQFSSQNDTGVHSLTFDSIHNNTSHIVDLISAIFAVHECTTLAEETRMWLL